MQIKTKVQNLISENAHKLTDLRFVGQVVFVVIVLLISWSGVKSIQTNYGLQKQITALKQQNELQQLKNENLNLQNEYYNTDQYLEVAARQNFGLAAPGETVLIVPKNVALANTIDTTPDNNETAIAKQPTYQRNFQSWVNFFLHRQNISE